MSKGKVEVCLALKVDDDDVIVLSCCGSWFHNFSLVSERTILWTNKHYPFFRTNFAYGIVESSSQFSRVVDALLEMPNSAN